MVNDKQTASASESRSERKTVTCGYCGEGLPKKSRPDREYCDAHCRRLAFERKAGEGRVRRVTVLKSGDVSVTYHIRKSKRRPGDIVTE